MTHIFCVLPQYIVRRKLWKNGKGTGKGNFCRDIIHYIYKHLTLKPNTMQYVIQNTGTAPVKNIHIHIHIIIYMINHNSY